MKVPVGVVIPTLPERRELLNRAHASVEAQTVSPAHLGIVWDFFLRGPAWARNTVAHELMRDYPGEVEWLAFLDDDDVWLPHHVETLWKMHLGHPDAHVLYTRGKIVDPTRPGWDPQRFPFPAGRMRRVNSLPCTGMVRADVFAEVGGFPDRARSPRGYEDWGLWLRLLDAGCEFVGEDVTTWQYNCSRGR